MNVADVLLNLLTFFTNRQERDYTVFSFPASTRHNAARSGINWLIVNPAPPVHGRSVDPRPRRSASVTVLRGHAAVDVTAAGFSYLNQTDPSAKEKLRN